MLHKGLFTDRLVLNDILGVKVCGISSDSSVPPPPPTCPNYDGTMTVQLLHVQNDMISVLGIQDQLCSSFDFAGADGSSLIVCAE